MQCELKEQEAVIDIMLKALILTLIYLVVVLKMTTLSVTHFLNKTKVQLPSGDVISPRRKCDFHRKTIELTGQVRPLVEWRTATVKKCADKMRCGE